MMELGELIARIEGLTGPDRELDCEIAWVTEWDTQGMYGVLWRGRHSRPAIALVLATLKALGRKP